MRKRIAVLCAIAVGCGGEAAQVGYIAESPVPLPEELAAARTGAIAASVETLLAAGEANIRTVFNRVQRYAEIVDRHAAAHGEDPWRIRAIIAQESSGDPSRESPAGAVGLMQLMPATAMLEGTPCGLTDASQRTDPERNICTGVTYYAALTDRYGGDGETALARYNFGGVDAALAALPDRSPMSVWALQAAGALPKETAAYVPRILAWEGIFRFLAQHDAVPVVAAEIVDAPSFSFAATGGRRVRHRPFRHPPRVITRIPPSDTAASERVERVWFTAREGDTYIGVVFIALDDPNVPAIDALNPVFAVYGLTPSAQLLLPPDRYAFHVVSGGESYAHVAHANGMAAATILRWNGRWTDRDVVRARAEGCAQDGCDAGDEEPVAGTPMLVRRQ